MLFILRMWKVNVPKSAHTMPFYKLLQATITEEQFFVDGNVECCVLCNETSDNKYLPHVLLPSKTSLLMLLLYYIQQTNVQRLSQFPFRIT